MSNANKLTIILVAFMVISPELLCLNEQSEFVTLYVTTKYGTPLGFS